MNEYTVSKTNSKAILATINQVKFDLEVYFSYKEPYTEKLIPFLENWIADRIFLPIAGKNIPTHFEYWGNNIRLSMSIKRSGNLSQAEAFVFSIPTDCS